jgi:hypothetical protein
MPVEMPQTLLTNKKQGKKIQSASRLYNQVNLVFAFTGRNMYISMKNEEPLNKFKIIYDSYLGKDLSIHINKSHVQCPFGDPVLLS